MKRVIIIGFFFVSLVSSLSGNIAAPYGIRPVVGDPFAEGDISPALRIEKELLILDVSKPNEEGSPCSAEYSVLNLIKEHVDIKLIFLTPSASNVLIFINDEIVQSTPKEIPVKDIQWLQPHDFPEQVQTYSSEEFPVHFDPGELKKIQVRFSLKAGWHNMSVGYGPTAPQAAHLLNMMKKGEHVSWYVYDLFAATTFGSKQFNFEVIIKTPKKTDLICDLPLTPHSSPDDDCNIFTGTFLELPAKFIDFKLVYKIKYNFLGLSVGLGCGFPFDGRGIHFLSRLYVDFFISNHQISCGIDANPWKGMLHGSLIYTLFPPGRSGYNYAHLVDIRGGGGILYDFIQDKGVGIRLFAGLKLFLPAYEVYYDFFPFSDDETYYHELGIVCVIGI